MEKLVIDKAFWAGRRIFVTGHTGFKGSWLSLWLQRLGAEIHGYALNPPTTPSLFEEARVGAGMASHVVGDIRDRAALTKAMADAAPELVLHLAAQPLVRHSYVDPVETYETNVLGTVNLFEAVRATACVRAVLNVTTDKCYENREWHWGYREDEPLGGHDPYSNSKACSELVTAAYRASFLATDGIAVASARAGNVIGGGDFAADRLVPDFFRARAADAVLETRSPNAIRPWQHVLEPLSGYLTLARALIERPSKVAEAFNFGPADEDARPVRWILECLAEMVPGSDWTVSTAPQPHEAHYLKLDSSKARAVLGWDPRWNLRAALAATSAWYQDRQAGGDVRDITNAQIAEYEAVGTAG